MSGPKPEPELDSAKPGILYVNFRNFVETLSNIDPEPIGNAHFVHVPYNSFTTQNGFVVIAVITDAFWEALLDVVNVDNLRDSKFNKSVDRLENQEFIESELNKILSTKR